MAFDEKISATVSLSRILDCFLVDGEPPSTIFSFLDMYSDKLRDILGFSCMTPRMFSLDFLKRCRKSELESLVKIMERVSSDECDCLVWQIFCCKDVPDDTKTIFKELQKGLSERRRVHPYGGIGGKRFETIDSRMLSLDNGPFELASAVNGLSMEEMKSLSSSAACESKRSLFTGRILQTDVFELVEPMHQFVFLNTLPEKKWNKAIHKGLKQILSADFHIDMKKLICGNILFRLDEVAWIDYIDNETIKKSESFNEFLMKSQIRGDWNLIDWGWVLYRLVVQRGINFFRNCGKYGKSFLHEHLDITELLD